MQTRITIIVYHNYYFLIKVHELSMYCGTLASWVRIPLRRWLDVCMLHVCVWISQCPWPRFI